MKKPFVVSLMGIDGIIRVGEYKDKKEMIKELSKLNFNEITNLYIEGY